MTNKNELNELELNKISGGGDLDYYVSQYTNRIDYKDVASHLGELLCFSHHVQIGKTSSINWIIGTLNNVYEKSDGCGSDKIAKVNVHDSSNPSEINGLIELNLETWIVYSK